MSMDAILGLVRHVLTFAAGFLVANNFIGDAEAQQAIGALMALTSVVWSTIEKRNRPPA